MSDDRISNPVTISKKRLLGYLIISPYSIYLITTLIIELKEYYTNNYASSIVLGYTFCYILYFLIKFTLSLRILIHGIKFGFDNQKISATEELWGFNILTNFMTIQISALLSTMIFILSIIIIDIYFRRDAYLDDISQYPVINFISVVYLVGMSFGVIVLGFYFWLLCAIRNGNRNIILILNRRFNIESIEQNIPIDMSKFKHVNTNKDNICAYCTFEIENNTGVKGICNDEHIFHEECLENHRKFCIEKNEEFRCPLCRVLWETEIV